MRRRRDLGYIICQLVALILGVTVAAFISIVLLMPVRHEYTDKTLKIVHFQNQSLVLSDGSIHKIDNDEYNWIDSDYPGIFFESSFNILGWEISNDLGIIDPEGEFYKHVYFECCQE
jgi:hypothetical protein